MKRTVTVEGGWNGKGEHNTGTATGGGCSSGVEGLRSKGEGGILLVEGNCELL